MATMTSVKNWLCKCGVSLQVVAEIDPSQPVSKFVKCPNCESEEEIFSAQRIISIRQEKGPVWEERWLDK
jgi:hypothetical protein